MSKKPERDHDIGGPTTGGMTPKDPSLVGKEAQGASDPGLPTSGGLTPKSAPHKAPSMGGTAPAPKKVAAPPVPAKKAARKR